MEFKGTKGKWKAVNLGSHWNNKNIDNIQIQHGDDGECVSDHVYCEYDALLISKAPEMLETLKEVYSAMVEAEANDKHLRKRVFELIKQATTLQND